MLSSSCRKDNAPAIDLGYNYYPTAVGTFVTYDCMEVVHDDAVSLHDTTYYQLKEKITEEFVDLEGRNSLRIERYKRDSSHYQWQISDVWYAHRSAQFLEKIEENVKFNRLIFGVREGKEWDGNAPNINSNWDYTYKDVDMSLNLNGTYLDSTVKVVQRDLPVSEIPILHEYVEHIYARNIGLVRIYHKELRNIDLFDTLSVNEGYELYQDYLTHGIE